MHQQFGQPRLRLPYRILGLCVVQIQPQRQGVNEQPSRLACAFSLHAPEQHCAKYHPLLATTAGHHLPPSQVAQSCQANSQPPRMRPQTIV